MANKYINKSTIHKDKPEQLSRNNSDARSYLAPADSRTCGEGLPEGAVSTYAAACSLDDELVPLSVSSSPRPQVTQNATANNGSQMRGNVQVTKQDGSLSSRGRCREDGRSPLYEELPANRFIS